MLNITIGALIILVTTRIHAEGMFLASMVLRTRIAQKKERLQRKHIYLVGAIVLIMFLTSIVEVLVWAFVLQFVVIAVETLACTPVCCELWRQMAARSLCILATL